MCVCLVALNMSPHYPMVILHNRDEYFDRPAVKAMWGTHYFGGKDLPSNGTWLGVNRLGQIGLLTNYRDPNILGKNKISRGLLIPEYFKTTSPKLNFNFLSEFDTKPYNMIVGGKKGMSFYSSLYKHQISMQKGVYTLSNQNLNTPWPKTKKLKEEFSKLKDIFNLNEFVENLMLILHNKDIAADKDLPDTGIPLNIERMISSIFVSSSIYGTRASTVVIEDAQGKLTFVERSYNREGVLGEVWQEFFVEK